MKRYTTLIVFVILFALGILRVSPVHAQSAANNLTSQSLFYQGKVMLAWQIPDRTNLSEALLQYKLSTVTWDNSTVKNIDIKDNTNNTVTLTFENDTDNMKTFNWRIKTIYTDPLDPTASSRVYISDVMSFNTVNLFPGFATSLGIVFPSTCPDTKFKWINPVAPANLSGYTFTLSQVSVTVSTDKEFDDIVTQQSFEMPAQGIAMSWNTPMIPTYTKLYWRVSEYWLVQNGANSWATINSTIGDFRRDCIPLEGTFNTASVSPPPLLP